MEGRYKIGESVGKTHQAVHSYEDLEKHHPTWKENPRKRHYGDVDGAREEFVYSPSGEKMVSKDFFLTVEGNAQVEVPSPAGGYIRRSPAMDRWGTVEIYDGPGKDAQLIARVRHMAPIHVKDGQEIHYGESLGQQGSKAPPGIKVGLHTHIDFSEGHLDQFKRYFRDIDRGVITPDRYPGKHQSDPKGLASGKEADATTPEARASSPVQGPQESVLKLHSRGPEVWGLQTTLRGLGYTGTDGQPLKVDSDFGNNTDHAVRAFQRAHGLEPVDGKVGEDTRAALMEATKHPLVSEATHPNHKLYAAIGAQLPAGTDPKAIANVTMQALENRITSSDKLAGVTVQGTDVTVFSTTPGFRPQVDLTAPTGSLQSMSDHMARQTQERVQDDQRVQERRQAQAVSA